MHDSQSAALAREPHAFRLTDGTQVILRPIWPRDAGLLQDYFRNLSAESRRDRLLAAASELGPASLRRLSSMDGPGELALMAFVNGDDGAMIGEAILASAPDSERCEIALSVADAWRRRGLGTLLLRNMECRARARGARHLFGDVLRTNTAMKCLARREGFSIRGPFTDARLVEIVKDLAATPHGLPCHEIFAELSAAAA